MKLKMQPTVVFVLFFVLLLSGCTASTAAPLPPTPSPTVTPTPQPDCSAEVTPDFSGYQSWTKVNLEPIKGHEVFVDIYVSDLAKETYVSASGEPFPVCSMIVKPHLESEDSETITAVTVMVKMPAGYDPENNDWWWGMYDKDAKVAKMSGKVPVCIACHKPAAAADYVFSQKVMDELNP